MVGVGVPLIKELGGGRKLVLTMDWESDVGLVQGKGKVYGDLPGLGCTIYSLKVSKDDGQPEEPLQEFRYTGGSGYTTLRIPGIVRITFEGWYEKLMAGGPAEPRPTPRKTAEIPQIEPDGKTTPAMKASEAREREERMKRAESLREEVIRALAELEYRQDDEKDAVRRPRSPSTTEPVQLPEGVSPPPDGYRLFSTDGKIAQKGDKLFGRFLAWDHASKTWTNRGGGLSPIHLFAYGAGEDGQGAHYDWDEQRGLWVLVANPPKPPPPGAKLSSSHAGFADSYLDGRYVYYQWDEQGHEWILVDPVPSGYRIFGGDSSRLEATSLDDFHFKIYWDEKRRSWIDPRTDGPPIQRPLPPAPAVVIDEDSNGSSSGDLAKVEGRDEVIYYLWNKHKQRWVRLLDLPPGFHRGEDPKEAYQTNGSAFDRWIEWDTVREAWVDFDPGRRLNIRGRIQ